MSDLRDLVRDLPDSPGVYFWKNEKGDILYIGKAKSLRKRTASYLRTRGLELRIFEMMQHATDIEVILTNTEKEALILEATLIKKHQPKYNIALKDDRRQTWVKVNLSQEFPSFEITRDTSCTDAQYFGPYGSSKRLERVFDTVRRHIPIAMCKDPAREHRVCLDHHLGRCAAPCIGKVSHEEYRQLVEQMMLYLDGRLEKLTELIQQQMAQAAQELNFEKAAVLRDRLHDIAIILQKQRIVEHEGVDSDIMGIARTEQASLIELLIVRNGRLLGHDNFYFETPLETPDRDIIKAFVEQYYFTLPRLPSLIIVPTDFDDMDLLSCWLSETYGHEVSMRSPADQKEVDLVTMAQNNAHRALKKTLMLEDRGDLIIDEGVKELREVLHLHHAPIHIEGFDISNVQGMDATGSCVVFKNGAPDKSQYRMFRIRSKSTPDDYAMMYEVVYRRYKGVLERGEPLPDLILIDGGKGHLRVVLDALEQLGLETLAVVAIAKREEILYTPTALDGVSLEIGSKALSLLQRVRDEAHRFAQKYHHKLRERRFTGSILEEIPGIGPKRRAALMREFGSIEQMREAHIDDILRVDGMTLAVAQKLRAWLDELE